MMIAVVDVIYGVREFNSWKLGRLMEQRFIDHSALPPFCIRLKFENSQGHVCEFTYARSIIFSIESN